MSYRIKCYTLFDITRTGIFNRKAPINYNIEELKEWEYKRNSQSNYDTILQIISLRSQPENNTDVTKQKINFKEFSNFGFLFEEEEDQTCWSFEFIINHRNVFHDGINELGALYSDADGVPILKLGNEWEKLPNFLDTSPELKNIHFEILDYE